MGEGLGLHRYGGSKAPPSDGLVVATSRKYHLAGALLHVDEGWNRRAPDTQDSGSDGIAIGYGMPAGVSRNESGVSQGHFVVLVGLSKNLRTIRAPVGLAS